MTQALARLVDVKRLTLDRAAKRPACGGRLRRSVSDPKDRRRVLVSRKPNSRLGRILPAIFSPLGDDMAAVTANYTARELGVISDFLTRTGASS
jgi:hypothetical protein